MILCSDVVEEVKSVAEAAPEEPLPINSTGSARTEGFKRVKKVTLATQIGSGLNKQSGAQTVASSQTRADEVLLDSDKQLHYGQLDLSEEIRRRSATTPADARMGRDLPLSSQYRIMKSGPPRAVVGHSQIHEWGLFATSTLEEGTIVIEYVGELIRQRIADLREVRYDEEGLGSVYMFKLDEEFVIDASKRGNIGRFINHSCDVSQTFM